MERWEKAQAWEKSWWGNCVNTLSEEKKQVLYAQKMGLKFFHDGKSPYNINTYNLTIVDFGGGPCSLLLKCVGFRSALVVDPLLTPRWVESRYATANIFYQQQKAEDFDGTPKWDEAWIYNVLQHVDNPQKVIEVARKVSKLIRIFEWINTPPNVGHPNRLTEDELNQWLDGEGRTESVYIEQCKGLAYYGVFV